MNECPFWCDKKKFEYLGRDDRVARGDILFYRCNQCGRYYSENRDGECSQVSIDDPKLKWVLAKYNIIPAKIATSNSPLDTAISKWLSSAT